jgi:hypothetical protein
MGRAIQWIASKTEDEWAEATLVRPELVASKHAVDEPQAKQEAFHVAGPKIGHEEYQQIVRLWMHRMNTHPAWRYVCDQKQGLFREGPSSSSTYVRPLYTNVTELSDH